MTNKVNAIKIVLLCFMVLLILFSIHYLVSSVSEKSYDVYSKDNTTKIDYEPKAGRSTYDENFKHILKSIESANRKGTIKEYSNQDDKLKFIINEEDKEHQFEYSVSRTTKDLIDNVYLNDKLIKVSNRTDSSNKELPHTVELMMMDKQQVDPTFHYVKTVEYLYQLLETKRELDGYYKVIYSTVEDLVLAYIVEGGLLDKYISTETQIYCEITYKDKPIVLWYDGDYLTLIGTSIKDKDGE